MKTLARYIITILAVSVFTGITVSAVEYQGVGGRPANPVKGNERSKSIFIYELKPSQKKTDAVQIYNNTDTERTIKIDAVDSIISSGGAFACAQSAEAKKDVGAWVQTEQANSHIASRR